MHSFALRLHLFFLAFVVLGAGADSRVLAGIAVAGLSALLVLWAVRALRGGPRLDTWSPVGVRDRARRTTFVRQRDPDAAGRPRPRAPSASPAPA
ncbi:hypothetical protein Misp01_49540 [Microtetraspora sp. NBRC 13810]|uniref:DUF6412 domain-containing protein n=1 Tax=Microtetraspora sp. NBRC 13810 TaxID=3030990 RepID=UPI0024A5C62E|nr:DUF6412 domain-containing protein [Microtetraspora sp. NBRC 13810]GLW09825.1 hypothetical protein Misp01_49540 [Microtetraspora sp. NBRC 13810]